jgi:hypothetical protein
MITEENKRTLLIDINTELARATCWADAMHIFIGALYNECPREYVATLNKQLRIEAEECISNHVELSQACKKEVIIEWVIEQLKAST